jgi:hypothetical protein
LSDATSYGQLKSFGVFKPIYEEQHFIFSTPANASNKIFQAGDKILNLLYTYTVFDACTTLPRGNSSSE